jgi:hypothetical protein
MTVALAHGTRSSVEMIALRPDEVVVTGRHRADLGDLSGLMESIQAVGLLNPITVTADMQLVAGQRRLEACRRLGRPLIRACVVSDLSEVQKQLIAERDENTCRLEMKPSEKASLGLSLEEFERPKAVERKKATQAKPGEGRVGGAKFVPPTDEPCGKLNDIVGEAVGMSRTTYHRAKSIVVAAQGGTDLAGDPLPDDVIEVAKAALIEMDATGKVLGPYGKLKDAQVKRALLDDPFDARTDKSRDAVAKRWAKVAELAATAHTSRQIAEKLGLNLEGMRSKARERGIEFPADAVVGRTRRIDPNRVVEETVIALHHSAASLSAFDIDFTALDPAQCAHWVTSLQQSLSTLTRLKKQLQEMTQ